MKLIVHDIDRQEFDRMYPGIREDESVKLFEKGSKIANCIGCFGCWIQTPGQCAIRDNFGDMGRELAHCDELILISRCVYGGYSPFVKNVMDRSIPYLHPDFIMRNGQMHHKNRYEKVISMKAYFYGEDLSEKERQTAVSLVAANAVNFSGAVKVTEFYKDLEGLKEVVL